MSTATKLKGASKSKAKAKVTASKGKAKATASKSKAKKVAPTKPVINNQYGKGGKTGVIRTMAKAGKTRKAILDKLCDLNPDVTRKTNSGLVSVELGKLGLRDIPSGVVNGSRKKTIKVKAKSSKK